MNAQYQGFHGLMGDQSFNIKFQMAATGLKHMHGLNQVLSLRIQAKQAQTVWVGEKSIIKT